MSRKKKEERKTQKGKFKNKLCFLAAAIAAGTITTEDKKLYGGNVCTVRVTGVTTGNPTTLGSAPGTDAIACGDGAIANGMSAIATGKGSFTGYNKAVAIGENATALRESDVAIGAGAGLYNQGLNAKTLPNTASKTRGYNVIIGANAMVGDDNNTSVHTSQGIAIGGSGTTRDAGARKYGDSGGAWAKGDQSIAIGGDTIAEGHSSIAIGGDDLQKAATKSVTYTLGSGSKTASLLTAMSDLAGVAPGDITSFNATKSGSGAVALGVKSISGDLSLAIGTMSKANKVNATAVGTGAVADLDNSVAIGGGATTVNAAGTQETSATINGVTYSNFAGGSGTKVGDVVSLGKNGTFNRQIKNVAAGNISATSTDAVNGSQLYSVAQTLQDRFKYVSINSTETGNADNKGALATNSIAIGPNASATVTSENAVVVGNGAKTTEQVMNSGTPTQWTKTGKNSVVIGNKASTNSEGSVAIGHEAKVDNTTNNSGSTIGRYKNDDNSTYMGTSLAQNNIYADPSYVGTQGIAIGANSYSDYQGMSMGVGARSKNLSLALGYFSNAEGTSSIATGVGAYAKGDNSISSGRQSSTISTGSVALGVAARGGSTADGGLGGSIAVGAASDATHEQAIAIGGITNANTATLEQGRGDNTQATAARATAIGANAKAQAESSIAFGTKANVGSAGTNAVAIGKDSSATVANGVALGSESKATTAAGVTGFDMADGRSNVYSGLAGTAKTANMAAVSVGDGANKTRQITGVAAGKEDTDAVNVAQLKSTNLKIAGNTTSGGADVRLHDQTLTVKGDGTYLTSTAAGNTITMELKQDVKDKIDNAATKKLDNLDPAGVQKIKDTAAWNVVANSGTAEKVQGGDTVKFINGDNIEITQAGKDFTFATKKDVTFDSVTINNGPKLSSTGIDAGNKTISNVANGTANNDAVNLGQLNNAINNATTTATSTEKVVASTAADNIATVAPSTGQNLGDKNATYEVSVSKTAVQNIAKDAAAWNVSTNGGTAEKVEGGDTVNFVNGDNIEVTNTGKDITIATKRDVNFDSVTINNGPKLSSTGVDAGNKKITNVADGTVGAGSKDAVNGGQLHDVKTSVTNNTTALNDLKNNTISLGGDTGTTNTQALDKTGGIKFNVKGDGTYLTSSATGDDVTLDLTQTTKDKINNAATNKLDNLDPAGVQKIKDTAAWNVVANSGTAEKVQGGDTVKFINGDNIEITQAGKDFTFATKKDVTFDSVTINNGPKLSSTGIDAGNKTISNVANGTANNDAVNLGQLNNAINNATTTATSTEKVVASTAADNIATVAPSTGQNLGDKNATYEVSVSKTAVQNIAKDAAAWNVSTNGGTAEKVEGGDTVNFVNGDNIEVTNTGKDITIATKRDVNFDSVTINNGPKLSSTGVDAGNKKITNVADGTVGAGSKDAVNGGQLHDVKTSVTNNTTALNDLKSNTIKLSGDSTSTTAERLDKNGGIEFGVKSGDTNYLTSTATGTDITLDLTSDTKAKIDKVTTLSNNTISLGGDTGTTNTQSLDKTGGIKFNVKGDGTYLTSNATNDDVTLDLTQATKDKINNAATNKLDNLDPTGVQKIKDTAAWNVVANSGTAEKVQGGDTVKFINGDNIEITQAGKDFTFATKKDVTFDSVTINNGPKLSSTGVDAGNKKITNVADGTVGAGSKDAVNGGQLHDVKTSVTNNTTALNDLKSNTIKLSGDSTSTTAERLDKNGGIEFGVKSGDTNYLTSTATGTDITLDLTSDTKAKIDKVTTLSNNTISLGGDTGTTNTQSLDKTGGIKFNVKGDGTYLTSSATGDDVTLDLTQTTKDKINNAATNKLDNLDPAGVQKIKDTAAWNVVANSGTAEKVQGGDTVKFINGDNIEITQAGKDFTFATKKDVTFDSVTINNGPKLSSTGIDAGNKKISNLADGTANNDAVNLGQLNNAINNATATATSTEKVVASTAADNIATVAPSTGQNLGDKNATYEVSVSKTAVQNIAKDAAAWNVSTNGGTAEKVEGGDTVNFVNGDNIEVTNTGKDITIATKRDVNFDSVTINNGPKLSSTGVDAGNKKITNVADGTVGAGSKDAVNGGQLHDVKTSVTNNTTALNNLKNNTISLGGDTGTTNTQTLDKTGGIKFNVKGDGTYLTSNATGDDVTLDLTQTTKDKINNAATNKLDNLDPAGVQKIKDTAAWNVVANSGTAEKVQGGDTVKFINGDNIEITQAGKDFTFATKKDVTFDSVTINNGPKLSSTGIDAGNKTISNVANGTANNDAVNLGQLNNAINNATTTATSTEKVVASTAADNIATVAPSTGQNLGDKNATYEVSVSKTAVQNIAKDAAAWNVSTNGGTAEKVEGGDTVNFVNGDNIEVTNTGKDITIATKRDVNFDSVTVPAGAGNVVINNSGINAGNNKITNVADGTVAAGSKDAINGGQLHDVKTSVTNNTTALNDLKSNTIKLSGDSTSTTAERLDKNGGIEFGVKSGDTNYLTSTATGTDITLDLTSDTKAKIDKVTTLSSNTISLGGDTGTTNTQSLDKTGGIKFNVKGDGTYLTSNATNDDVTLDLTQTTKDKINNAATNKLDNLDPAGVQKIKDTAAWNVVANSGTAEKVQGGDTVKFINGDNIEITQAGKDFTFATKKDVTFDSVTINNGPKLSSTGIDAGNKKISNLADGTANNDAVNLGQLNNAINNATATATSTEKVVASTAADNIATVAPSTGQNLGDKNATYEVSVSKTAVQNIAKDAAAWNVSTNGGTAEKVEGGDTVNFVNGDNIEVTNTGKDITIATKRDVNFDSVTVPAGAGNVVINNSGINAGNNKITNVADGTVAAGSKDAINGGQLHDVKTSVTNNTTALNDLKSNTIKLSGDSTSTTAERLDKNGGIEFGVKSGDTNYLTSTATGTDITLDLTSDTKAKIDKVTTLSNNTISLGGDTGTTNTQALDKTGGIKFNVKGDGTYLTSNATNDDVTLDLTQTTKDKINNAATNKLDNLDPAGVQKIKDTAAWNVVANSGTAEKVQGGDTVKFINGDNIEITQAGKDFTFATKKDVTFDSVTINNGPKLSSTGIDAGNKKISNLADGTANNDAVNLGQLNTAINNAGAAATIKYKANGGAPETVKLSDGLDFVNGSNTTATVGPNGVVKYDVNLGKLAVGADGKAGADGKTGADGTVGKDGIATTQDVAKAINSSAWKVTSTASTGTVNTPSVEDVKNGDTVKFDAGDNIEITQNGKDFTFATKKDVTFDSVTINNGGPKLSATGIDAANKKITNVANGDVTATSKDAVNGSQLYGLSKNTVTVSGDSTSTTPQTLDQTGGIKLGIKSGDTNFLTSTATGTDVTLDLTQATKDKINKVTTLSSNTISLGGDTGTTNTQSLDKTGGIKFNVKGDGTYLTSNATNDDVTLDLTQATKDKINNAATNKLDNLDPAGIQKIKDTAAWNVVANNGTAEKVEGGNTVKFIDGDNIAITQAGKDFTIATKRDVNFDSVTVPAGAGNVVINNSGINAGNNKITNVADGTIAPGSKDAVNGGQLHDVQNTINAGAFTVSANGGAKDRIAKDENIDFENADGNIAISYDATGNKFTYNLSPNLNLGPAGSLRIGDALLNNGGLTIVNGPSITSAGVDAGNKKITNVADGTIGAGSKDAINGGQLHDVQTNLQTSINNNAQNIANNTNAINNLNAAVNNPITFTGDSGNNIDRKLGETLNIKGGATGNLTSGNIGVEADSTTNTLNVKLAENIDLGTNGSVKMGDTKIDDNGLTINGGPSVTKAGIDAGNKKVTNVANGDITATSKDAVNGSQLHGVADSIKNSIGGNTILNPDGTITTSNIGGTGQNNIHDAISAVNSAANQRTTVVAGDNIDVTVSTNATGGNEYTVATKRDIVVDSVSVANNGPSMNSNGINAGGKTISNLGAGVNPNDAVNVAQLDAVKNSPITFGADTGTDHAATLGSRVSITGDNKNITTSISGNNIQVAMSDTPSFGTVNVNDANTGTITGASNVTLDNLDEDGTVGRVATEAQLAAVRNEVAGTKDIDNKLRGFKRGADAGTASAMAMAGIPQVINPGENAIGASISAYKQQTAVAVGYTRASKNGRAVLKISGSVNSNSELGFSLGFMKGWD